MTIVMKKYLTSSPPKKGCSFAAESAMHQNKARIDSKGKADMKLVGTGTKLGSSVLIKEGNASVLGRSSVSRGISGVRVRLSRWNQPAEMGVTQQCCKCVVTTMTLELCHMNPW